MNVDKENTVRALREEPLFARRQWQCKFGFHTWLKWGSPRSTRRGAWEYLEQYRECGCCGLVQRTVLSKV